MDAMRAAVCREFGQPLVIEEVTLDPPGPGEVQVRIAACAICHSDIHAIDGDWGGMLPAVFGHEAAGVVEAPGDGVEGVRPGDHVVVTLIRHCGGCHCCAQGAPYLCESPRAQLDLGRLHGKAGEPLRQGIRTAAFAERVVVDQSQVVPIPPDVPLDSASLLACGVITGLGAVVNTAKVPAGSSVVVIGAGGVGLNSVQGATLSGAAIIVAVDVVAGKLEAARAFGATHTISLGADGGDVAEQVRAFTGGRGADYVIVTVGSPQAIEQGVGLLCPGGTLVAVGMPPSGAQARLEVVAFAGAGQRILGSKMGSTRPSIDIPRLVALYQQGRLKLDELITARYPLEEINQAISNVKRGEALRNVIVF
jgi:S-(hydroxymethyl)glutathione dehydrogenase/alcohol dehydrogenase